MLTATERLVGGEGAPSDPLVEALPKRADDPEWHTLRLFGRGRHPGTFGRGAEQQTGL